MSNLERTLAEVVAALFLIWGTILYLEHRGAAACVKADVIAAAKQQGRNEAKAETDAQTINQEAIDHDKAIAAAPEPTPVLLCVRKYTTSPLSSAAAPKPISDGATDSPTADSPATGDNPAPDLAKIGQLADAQIIELQSYVRNVCLVR